MADNLEAISTITGRSQSEFLEAALGQPIMRRLWAFAHPEDVNPIVELLETYQIYEDHMNPRTGEYILQAVKEWVEKHAVINKIGLMQNASDVNSYIFGHMTEGSKKADPYFKNIHRMAKMKLFITLNMKEKDLKNRVVKYIDTMLVNPTDKNIMGGNPTCTAISLSSYRSALSRPGLKRLKSCLRNSLTGMCSRPEVPCPDGGFMMDHRHNLQPICVRCQSADVTMKAFANEE